MDALLSISLTTCLYSLQYFFFHFRERSQVQDKHVTKLLSRKSGKTASENGDRREHIYESKWPHFKSLIFNKDNVTPRREISFLVTLFMI